VGQIRGNAKEIVLLITLVAGFQISAEKAVIALLDEVLGQSCIAGDTSEIGLQDAGCLFVKDTECLSQARTHGHAAVTVATRLDAGH